MDDSLEHKVCPLCGCEALASASMCPLCGAELPCDEGGQDVAECTDDASSSGSVRRWLLSWWVTLRGARHAEPSIPVVAVKAATVGGLVLLCLLAFVIGRALLDDWDLRQRAESTTGVVVQSIRGDEVQAASALGNFSGVAAAGGVVVSCGDGCIVATAEGIAYESPSTDEVLSLTMLLDGRCAYLNVVGSTLYFISEVTSEEGRLPGMRVCEADIVENASHVGLSSVKTLYEAAEGEQVYDLACRDGLLYFLSQTSSGTSLCCLDLDGEGSSAYVLADVPGASRSWLFVDAGATWLVSNVDEVESGAGWKIESVGLDPQSVADGAASLDEMLSGTGNLASACVVDQTLYYSTKAGQSAPALHVKSMQGDYSEFAQVASVCEIVSNGTDVVCLSADGSMWWMKAGSGVVRSLFDAASLSDGLYAAGEMNVGLAGGHVVLVGDDGSVYECGLSDGVVSQMEEG